MKRRLRNFLYNIDRAIASLFGAPPQETISSMAGREADKYWWAKFLHKWLDLLQPFHTEKAIKHADALDRVDDKNEQ